MPETPRPRRAFAVSGELTMSPPGRAWAARGLAVLEGIALLNRRDSDTLSEHLRRRLGIDPANERRKAAVPLFIAAVVALAAWPFPYLLMRAGRQRMGRAPQRQAHARRLRPPDADLGAPHEGDHRRRPEPASFGGRRPTDAPRSRRMSVCAGLSRRPC